MREVIKLPFGNTKFLYNIKTDIFIFSYSDILKNALSIFVTQKMNLISIIRKCRKTAVF